MFLALTYRAESYMEMAEKNLKD